MDLNLKGNNKIELDNIDNDSNKEEDVMIKQYVVVTGLTLSQVKNDNVNDEIVRIEIIYIYKF
jgi:hypothetical protein